MRLGIDARLPYFRTGGISEYVTNLLAALSDPGVLAAGDEVAVLQAAGDPVCRTPADPRFRRVDVRTPCHHPRERLLLGSELQPLALDVLHSPDYIPPSSGARRRVVSVFDLGFLEHPGHVTAESRRHYAGQIEWAVQSADAVITASAAVRRQVLARFGLGPDRVTAIPLAAAPRFDRATDPETTARVLRRHGLEPGFLLFVGTIEPRKNLTTLLAVHARLRATNGAPPLVLAGPRGWLSGDVEQAMASAPPDAVRWLGEVPAGDLPALYGAAGLLVLPSVLEGFGLPVLEAMRCGCPVVASTGGALPEVAGAAALLVEPFDVDGWLRAIRDVLDSPARAGALRSRGRMRASRFSWRETAIGTVSVYRGAAGARRAPASDSHRRESSTGS